MLNGKFYTGLPPKMSERSTRGANRQQSHLFWPDDTQVDSAVENRIKRRNSFQFDSTAKPRLQQQMSLDDSGVDTKQMFHKEFANSSIQFNDIIPEEPEQHQHQRRAGKAMKQEITAKPTATKLELPEHTIDEEYTTAKKQQTFTSKIKFYDYADEQHPSRNNARSPKMDMNDKKALERHTKNSPKLQVKRDVRNLSLPERRNDANMLDDATPERSPVESNESQYRRNAVQHSKYGESPFSYNSFENNRSNSRSSHFGPKANADHFNSSESIEQTQYLKRHVNMFSGHENTPKTILKNLVGREDYEGHGAPQAHDYGSDYRYIENGVANMHFQPPSPAKHVSYSDEQHQSSHQVDLPRRFDGIDGIKALNSRRQISSAKSFNAHAGNNQRQQPPGDQYMATSSQALNNSNYNKNKLNNQPPAPRKTSPKMSDEASHSTPRSPDAQQHLRSSLCFNDGQIVANNRAAGQTPTSTGQRRNARSSATQRVSVGLPD